MKEEIQTFDARKISSETRKGVEELLKKNKASFEEKVRKSTDNVIYFLTRFA